MPALPRATGSPSRSSLERRVSLSAWSAGSYGSPTVYNCERLRQAHTPKSAKPYDDDTDFTCVRRVVWKAPLTSEFFGAATETVALNSARHSKSLLMSSVRLDTESVLVGTGYQANQRFHSNNDGRRMRNSRCASNFMSPRKRKGNRQAPLAYTHRRKLERTRQTNLS